jgi:hypothetical protein
MNKQDEERVREIVREEVRKWYADNVAGPMLNGLFKLSTEFFGHGKAQVHESGNTRRNRS